MRFDDIATGGPQWTVPPEWYTGRGAFGGLTAAALTRAATSLVPAPVRTVSLTFHAPPTGTVRVEASVERAGVRVAFAQAVARDLAGRILARASITMGASRPGVPVDVPSSAPPVAPPPELWPPSWPEGAPPFTAHVVFVPTWGEMFTGSGGRRFGGWTRLRHPTRADEGYALALLDAWPPVSIAAGSLPVRPASTVTFDVQFVGDPAGLESGWGLVEVVGIGTRDGYATQRHTLWDTQGRMIAVAHQLVAS